MKKFIIFFTLLVVFINPLPGGAFEPLADSENNFLTGSIEQIGQLTNELKELNQNVGIGASVMGQGQSVRDSKITQLQEIAKKRKTLLLKLAEKDPRSFLSLAMKKEIRETFPSNVQNYIEKEAIIEAKTEVLHIDDFDEPENSKFNYFLRRNNEKLSFYPVEDLFIASGAKVRVKGIQLENTIAADINKVSFQILEPAPEPDSVGEQKTLALLIEFPDSGERPFTKEEARDIIFDSQFQRFYQEQSYNQVSFSGDVFGWFTLNRNGVTCGAETSEEFEKIISDNNINLGNYDRLLILVNRPWESGGCSGVGKWDNTVNGVTYRFSMAWIGTSPDFNKPSYWGEQPFEWTNLDFVLSHEMGHSLGVMHANGWDCQDQTLYGDCQHIEYGNYFDAMGTVGYSLHFNGFYKELLGWIKPGSFLLIQESGKYSINSLELDSPVKLAKIQIRGSDVIPFYLEYRQGIGFDANLNRGDLSSNQSGLFVNHIIVDNYYYPFPRLLDMSPTLGWWGDDTKQATLNGENIFTDLGRGISIGSIVENNTSSITFDVNLTRPICIRSAPLIIDQYPYSPIPIAAGGAGYLNVNFINADYFGCGDSEFTIAPTMPLSWEYDKYPGENVVLFPDQKGWFSIDFRVPEDTPPGEYSLKYEIVNLKSGLKTAKELVIEIVEPPVISSISPLSGPVGAEITLSGSGFDSQNPKNNWIGFSSWDSQSGISANGGTNLASSSGGTTLTFTFPDTVQLCRDECWQGETPLRNYTISVYTNGANSNSVIFKVVPELTVISPNGGEAFVQGVSIPIKWTQSRRLDNKTFTIYLVGYDSVGNQIYAKSGYQVAGSINKEYLIQEVKATANSINWITPLDLSSRFESSPSRYKLGVWSRTTGMVDTSDDYFRIAAPSGSLAVSLSANQPDHNIIPGYSKELLKMDLTAGPEEDIRISQIMFRYATNGPKPISNLMLRQADGAQLGSTIASPFTNFAFQNLNLVIPAGATRTLTLTADVSANTAATYVAFSMPYIPGIYIVATGVISGKDIAETGSLSKTIALLLRRR